ncbi:OmpH family outer membrane protein [Rubrivirga sp.]|uniref:OmpH family outer membrane protein n=1 Tax=Rubrivirga sp. TaxID=1885344 RepID=UPI003C75427D
MRSSLVLLIALILAPAGLAQQQIGYIDSDRILSQMPEFQSAQQALERQASLWQTEVEEAGREVERMSDEFAAREILFTEEERTRQLQAIEAKRQERDALRARYFGPQGELFREQQTQLRPAQERLLAAVEIVAEEGDYDYVFDRAGDYVFLYTRSRFDLTDAVLLELGVGVGAAAPGAR